MLSVTVFAVQLMRWVAPSHSPTVSIAATDAPEQTKYSKLATAVTASLAAVQLRVRDESVTLAVVMVPEFPAVGGVESDVVA